MVYREGPVGEDELSARLSLPLDEVRGLLEALITNGRLRRCGPAQFEAIDFVVPLGATHGWEAAVFDHLQAVIQTISQRLQRTAPSDPATATRTSTAGVVGGSTYSFDLGPDHPLAAEVKGQLENLRQRLGELRRRVDEHNRQAGLPAEYEQVVTYVGQCILEREQVGGVTDAEHE